MIAFATSTFTAEPDPFANELTRLLTEAEAQLAENPSDGVARVWKGRRPGYLGRLEEPIAVYEAGEIFLPKDARFARHVDPRLISLRRFEAERRSRDPRSTRLRGSCHASA